MKMLSAKAKICGLTLVEVLAVLAVLACIHPATAQGTRFFRMSGPAATTITAFRPDGMLVWSNALTDTNYTVQTVTVLPGGTNWVDYVQLPVTNSVNTNQIICFNPPTGMALIPAGSFTMGDTLDGESDAVPTNVYVSGFYMDINLVTSNQWATVYACATNQGYSFDNAGAGKAANYPVEAVNWYDCVKWCNARSQLAGLMPVYYTDAAFTHLYTNGDTDTVYASWTNNGYRLPTEAEWEKAARGGLSGRRFPWGDTISESQANYYALPGIGGTGYDLGPYVGFNTNYISFAFPYSSPVGSFCMNGYGLYDMAGNMSEWCWNWYGTPYGQPTPTNPYGPDTGIYRVVRGGNWYDWASYVRCAWRGYEYPNNSNRSGIYGIRCVRGL
jgi:formylglycine-generating enzyme required for sulfatase activity